MKYQKRLKRNAIKCRRCGDIIESKSRHDYVECSCGACFVDGGLDYCRIGGYPEDYESLTEYEKVPEYKVKLKSFPFESLVLGSIEEIKAEYGDQLLEIIDPDLGHVIAKFQ